MENIIIALVVVAIIAATGYYIYKSKKRGNKCIGCPHANDCKKMKL